MKNLPLVSILIPTYNQPEYFKQALESALNQDYPNIEIIVSDDSTDDRVAKVASEYKDKIQFFRHGDTYNDENSNERAELNIRNLLEHANGEFVNILFHDDLIYPQKISKMMDFFDDKWNNQIAIVTSLRDVIDGDGNITSRSDLLSELNIYVNDKVVTMPGEAVGRLLMMMCGNFIGEFSTVLMRRKDFFKKCINKFSTGYCFGIRDRSMGDISIYLEACGDGRGLAFIREPLSAFRLAGGNQNTYSGRNRINIVIDWLAIATGLYLRNVYIHDRDEFSVACKYWNYISGSILDFFQKFPETTVDVNSELLDQMIQTAEFFEKREFDKILGTGIDWIQKYSSDTFDVNKFAVKNSEGLWIRRGD